MSRVKWTDERRAEFFDNLKIKLDIDSERDWLNITRSDITKHGGGGLLALYYNSSVQTFVKAMLPHTDFKPWEYKTVPNGFWTKTENVRSYCDWLRNRLGFTSQDECYKISREHFKENRGAGLLDTTSNRKTKRGEFDGYGKGIIDIMKIAYPELTWYAWKFHVTSMGCWNSKENIVLFVKYVEDNEGMKLPTDWYSHTGNTVMKYEGGEGLLTNRFKGSLTRLLSVVYPDEPWKMYKFHQAPQNYWDSIENVNNYLKDLSSELNIINEEDWYKVSRDDFRNYYGGGLLDRYKSYINLIITVIDYPWNIERFRQTGSTSKKAIRYFQELQCKSGRRLVFKGNTVKDRDYEFRIPETRWHVDCYDIDNGDIIEYLGDYWHGNPNKHSRDYIHPTLLLPWGDIYDKTMSRINIIKNKGFSVEIVWESDCYLVNSL
jgi:hypothetical protein